MAIKKEELEKFKAALRIIKRELDEQLDKIIDSEYADNGEKEDE